MNDDYKIELFVFPDGTSVEMIVFDRAPAGRAPRSLPRCGASRHPQETATAEQSAPADPHCVTSPPAQEHDDDAHTCPVCGSRLVYPLGWDRRGDATWHIRLRCPNCETRREVVLGRAAVERLNRQLYYGEQALTHEAERLARHNFEEETERIVVALERDLIQPMDF